MFRLQSLVLSAILFAFTAFGQAPTGTLQGRVEDPNSASIPEAKVTIENQATGVSQNLITNNDGRFVQPYLPSGDYRLTVSKAGFTKSVTNDIKIDVQQTVSLNVVLKIGEITTTVEVQAELAQLKTETSSASTTITSRQLHDLPTGRNPFALATLTPGVIPGGGSTPWISGGRNASSEILIDGNTAIVPENNVSINDGGYTPVIDSVEELTVIKNSMAAEYGRSGGGVITVATRSGTNQLHFGLFEYFRNPALNANSWGNNRNAIKRANCCSQNTFGFNAGGPVYIPGVYDGRNKTFIFWSQQISRTPGSSSPTATVPIQAWRDGDFSQLKNGAGAAITIYDPQTVDPVTNIRAPFPGNIIPKDRLDPVALNLTKYWPNPNNIPTNAFTFANNFATQGKSKNTDNKFDSRIDHYFNSKFRMFLRGSYDNNVGTPFNGFGNAGTSIGDGPSTNTFPNITSNMVYTVNPTTIVNVNLGFGEKDVSRFPFSTGTLPSSLGFPKALDAIAALNNLEFPNITGTGVSNLGQATFTSLIIKSYAYTFHSDVTKVFSKHTIKAGFEYRKLMLNFTQYGAPSGQFGFGTSPTVRVVNVTTPTTEGFGFASFLLGLPNNNGGALNHSFSAATASPYIGVFAQDDWKVSRKLTVNLGLRWDVDVPRTERYNRLNHFDLFAPSPIAGKVPGFPDLKGAWVFQDKDHRRQVPTDLDNWGPRAGFAYQINSKTVFRGAYGILYSGSALTAAGTSGSSGTEGFQSNTAMNVTNDNFKTILTTLSNPFPSGYNLPLGAAGGAGTDLGLGIGGGNGGIFLDNQNPIIQQWNANIQRELPGGWVVEAGYLGSKGQHLIDGESNLPLNQLPASVLPLGDALNAQVPNPFFHVAGINTTSTLYSQATVQAKQLMTAYPQYTGISAFRIPQANSNYHSFTLEGNKRFSHGLQVLAAFTAGKLLDDASQTVSFLGAAGSKQDYYNRRGDKSISAQDVSRRLVISFNYDIPVGRHRPFLGNLPKAVDFAIGGWQINGIYVMQTALPFAIGNGGNNVGIGNPGQRPNNNGKSAKKDGPIDQRLNAYFDPTVFSVVGNWAFGNASRFSPDLRGPGTVNMDFSFFKHFRLRERLDTQIRAEAFNFFNHPTWGTPGLAVNSPGTFGVITSASGNRTMQVAMKINF
jgi:hypothetical protein